MKEALLFALIVGILSAAIYAPWATADTWRDYFSDSRTRLDGRGYVVPDRSKLLLLLALISSIVTVGMLIIGAIAGRRLLGWEGWEYAAHAVAAAVIMLGSIPALIRRTVHRIRSEHGANIPRIGEHREE